MIEDEGQATDLDADSDDPAPWWSLRLMADARALAVAALVLAAISLLGIEAGREIASAFEFSGHSGFHSLAIIDGIQAGVAVVAVGLGLSAIREEWYAEGGVLGGLDGTGRDRGGHGGLRHRSRQRDLHRVDAYPRTHV